MSRKYLYYLFACAFYLSIIITSCSNKTEITETIIARVGDKIISEDEFLRRAEYTIRPPYCRGNNNVDKKIVLNSLLAEKMLALEVGTVPEVTNNEHYQRYIQGRKEQAMRQWLYDQEGTKKVKLDTNEIKKVYRVAGRKYKVQFMTLNDSAVAREVQRKLVELNNSFEELLKFYDSNADTVPEKEIEWQSPESDIIHQALFSDTLTQNQVLGPLPVNPNQYLIMKIKGWTNRVVLSDKDIRQRWMDVREKLTEIKSLDIYTEFVTGVMEGKRMELDRDTFFKMAKFLGELYFSLPEKQKDDFLNRAFKRNPESPQNDSLYASIDELLDRPFFKFNDEVWTVRDFQAEYERHPLVFRNRKMKAKEFAEQLKFAIADMLRDRELAKVAYQRGYDQVLPIKRNIEMWQDSFLAEYQKQKYLATKMSLNNPDSLNYLQIINQFLNPYIDSLQAKYQHQVEIDVEKFNKLELTRIDMFVTQQNVPFPVVVPSFPIITTDHNLDYGRKMKENKK
jgi:uridine kinase